MYLIDTPTERDSFGMANRTRTGVSSRYTLAETYSAEAESATPNLGVTARPTIPGSVRHNRRQTAGWRGVYLLDTPPARRLQWARDSRERGSLPIYTPWPFDLGLQKLENPLFDVRRTYVFCQTETQDRPLAADRAIFFPVRERKDALRFSLPGL